jgi:hypothetical protein
MRKRPEITENRFDQWAEDLRGWIRKSVSPFENDTPKKQKERKERASWDILYFFKTYLPHYFTVDFEDFHEDWAEVSNIRGDICLEGAPREHAKSTFFSFGVPLHDIAYALRHFIIIISDSNDQATGFTVPIRLELEENPRLRHDFGDFQSAYGRRSITWKMNDFTTANGIRVLARGRGEKVRGLKNMQYRPDRVIVDDFENDQNVRNPKLVKQGMDWLLTAVLGSLADDYSFTMVGNLFASRSILAQLIKEKDPETNKPLYISHVYDVIREDGTPLWPALWPMERIEKRRRQMGTVRFNKEMRNRVGAEESPIKEDWIVYIPQEELAPDIWIKKHFVVSSFLDPSGKGTETSDFKAIVTVGQCVETSIIDTLNAWIRHATVNEMWAQVWKVDEEFNCGMGVEINMFQDFLIDSYKNYAERVNRWVNMNKVNHSAEKKTRIINRLSPLCEFRRLRFIKGNSDQDLLVEQIIYIMDENVNDDGPDALEAAISQLGSNAVCIGQNPAKHESPMGRGVMPLHKGGFFGRFGNRITMAA